MTPLRLFDPEVGSSLVRAPGAGAGWWTGATGMARSRDGVTWEWLGPVLEPSGEGWDAYETRISCLVSDDLAMDAYETRISCLVSDDLAM